MGKTLELFVKAIAATMVVIVIIWSLVPLGLAAQYAERVFNDPAVKGAAQQSALATMAIYHLLQALVAYAGLIAFRLGVIEYLIKERKEPAEAP